MYVDKIKYEWFYDGNLMIDCTQSGRVKSFMHSLCGLYTIALPINY